MEVDELNPQGKQMADESMVRNLAAQAQAIWPQEIPLLARYPLPEQPHILDAGCGTGEITSRLALLFPLATVHGVDIIDEHLALARSRYSGLAPRVTFEHESVYELSAANASFDLTVCRHVLHSIPFADRVIAELVRVTRSDGYLHLIPEDYGMLHFQRGELDPSDFWHEVPVKFEKATNTDLFIGRNVFGILKRLGLQDITADYIVVDTLRARELFAQTIEAWRDGYVDAVAEHTKSSPQTVRTYFDQMIANIRDPLGYAVWMIPVFSARKP
jgi:SAM-dependent methyltransferase